MGQRTFLLTGVADDFGGNPIASAPCSFQPLTPGGQGAIDGNGDFVQISPVGFTTDGVGAFSVAIDFPGDFQSPYVATQVRVTINGVITDSPIGFGYAASIALTSWINAPVTSGLVVVRAVYTKDDGTPIPGAVGSVSLSDSALVVATGAFLSAGDTVDSLAAGDGTMLFSLNPNSLLNPSDLGYSLTISGESRPWPFTVPTVVDVYRGAWNVGTTYHGAAGSSNGDVVTNGGALYRYINATPSAGNATANATYWLALGTSLPTDLIAAHLGAIAPSNGVIIGTRGVAASPTLTSVSGDPITTPLTLDDDLVDLAWRVTQRLRWLGAWSGVTAYLANDVVSLSSVEYVCILANTNVTPPNVTNWTAIGGGGGTSVITSEGDLIVGNAAGVAARLPIGNPRQMPGPVGGDVAWVTPSDAGGWVIPLTTDGDILYRRQQAITALTLGFIGDSITADTPSGGISGGNTPPQGTALTLSRGALTVGSNNQGHGGARTSDWLIGSGTGYLTTAMAAFAAAGVRLVHVMLGTNDCSVANAVSAATYGANLAAMCASLVGNGYTVLLSYPPYIIPGSQSGAFDATSDTRLAAYQAQINNLVNGQTILQGDTRSYLYFLAHQSELGSPSDGVHPNVTGCLSLETLWAAALGPRVQALSGETVLDRLTVDGTTAKIVAGVLSASGGGVWGPISNGGTSPLILNSSHQIILSRRT